MVAGLAVVVVSPSCGREEKPLTTSEMKGALGAACGRIAAEAGFADATSTSVEDASGFAKALRESLPASAHVFELSDLNAATADRAAFEVWIEAARDVFAAIDTVARGLERRDLDGAKEGVDKARAAGAIAEAGAADLGITECEDDVWSPELFDHAAAVIAGQEQALVPTGDYAADTKAICARFATNITNAPTDPDPTVNRALRFSAFRQALDVFARDLAQLEPPPGFADDHAALVAALEDLGDIAAKAVTGSGGEAVQTEFDGRLTEVTELIRAVNPDC